MSPAAFQDFYPESLSHCYGCGRLNDKGLHIRSYWDGDEAVCVFRPSPHHTAIPGYVYGGLIASVIDCHGTGTAAAAAYRAEGRAMDTSPPLRFLTGTLNVEYLKPTPIDEDLICRATVEEIKGRKVVISATVMSGGEVCARGRVIAIRIPETLTTES